MPSVPVEFVFQKERQPGFLCEIDVSKGNVGLIESVGPQFESLSVPF